jgi:multiple sugar transport system permease protein
LKRLLTNKEAYYFLIPTLVVFALFTVRSVVVLLHYSFYEYSGVGPLTDFVGWSNFVRVTNDPYFWNAFKNTFLFMFGAVPGQLGIGLVLALLVNRKLAVFTTFRTLYFLPVVTTAAIIGVLMPMLLSPANGPVDAILRSIGLIHKPVDWLGSRSTALWTVIVVSWWKWSGQYMVYWLAGLQTIPEELYEAADIEGAGHFRKFTNITLPLLAPIALIILLFCIIGSLRPFDLIKTMTDGGPFYASDVVMTYIYRYAFSSEMGVPQLGYASAAAIFYGAVLIIIGALQSIALRKRGGLRPAQTTVTATEQKV